MTKRTKKVAPQISAAAEPRSYLSRYVGNSAQVDKAREAYERADAWARDPEGRPYGSHTKGKKEG